jgi:tetratricopeptide (TPR) repeat protein
MLEIDPASVPALLERGLAYEGLGDAERAVADLSAVIEANVPSVPAYFGRAMAYKALERRDLARADLDAAMNLSHTFTAALHRERGFRLTRDKRYSEAISSFDKAIEIVPFAG